MWAAVHGPLVKRGGPYVSVGSGRRERITRESELDRNSAVQPEAAVLGTGGRDRPEAACPPDWRHAAGEAGGFNAVQKLFTIAFKAAVKAAGQTAGRC